MSYFNSANWISINGTKYKCGAIIHAGYSDKEQPSFWEILGIYIVNKAIHNAKFIVSPITTMYFDEHYQSYRVKRLTSASQRTIIYQKDFSSYLPLNISKPYGGTGKFIAMRVELLP